MSAESAAPASSRPPPGLHSEDLSQCHRLDWRQLRHLGRAMWPYRRLYAAAIACTLVMVACELVAPRLARLMVDEGIPSGRWASLLGLGGLWAAVVLALLLLEGMQIGL